MENGPCSSWIYTIYLYKVVSFHMSKYQRVWRFGRQKLLGQQQNGKHKVSFPAILQAHNRIPEKQTDAALFFVLVLFCSPGEKKKQHVCLYEYADTIAHTSIMYIYIYTYIIYIHIILYIINISCWILYHPQHLIVILTYWNYPLVNYRTMENHYFFSGTLTITRHFPYLC